MLPRPAVVVNVKTYPQTTGQGALQLAEAAFRVAEESGAGLALAVQAADLRLVANVGIPIYAQHFLPRQPGNHSGETLAPALAEAGATGSLINHAEHRLTLADIGACVAECNQRDWVSILCTNDAITSAAGAVLGPTYVAVEPPELIGGDISVTTADPAIVSESAEAIRRVNPDVRLLCGAGVKNGQDVATALELGADGVLLASGVAKAKDPEAALRDLVSKV